MAASGFSQNSSPANPAGLRPQPQAAAHIAVLDDERDITVLLAGYLGTHGFRTTQLHSGRELMALMVNDPPDLVLLDLGLPGEDGFVIARQLREHWHCGLVIVTGRNDAVDKVVGLEIGADDYVTKPFDLRELVARVKAVLRRLMPPVAGNVGNVGMGAALGAMGASGAQVAQAAREAYDPALIPDPQVPRELLSFDGWSMDVAARRLFAPDRQEVMLTGGEFDLLLTFLMHPARVLSRDFLLEHTRGRESSPFDRTIDVQVGRLRRKLGADAGEGHLIKSVRGAGYLFAPRVTSTRSS